MQLPYTDYSTALRTHLLHVHEHHVREINVQ